MRRINIINRISRMVVYIEPVGGDLAGEALSGDHFTATV